MKAKKGFTLVEILIVVVILGILAAIVIPQFTNASTEAKENSLKSSLQTLRSQISLYRVKSNDADPNCNSAAAMESDMVPDYLQKIPVNPFTGTNTITRGNNGDSSGAPGNGNTAWYFNTYNHTIYANDNATHAAY